MFKIHLIAPKLTLSGAEASLVLVRTVPSPYIKICTRGTTGQRGAAGGGWTALDTIAEGEPCGWA